MLPVVPLYLTIFLRNHLISVLVYFDLLLQPYDNGSGAAYSELKYHFVLLVSILPYAQEIDPPSFQIL